MEIFEIITSGSNIELLPLQKTEATTTPLVHTPTKQQWQIVIDNLEVVLPQATKPGHLRMSETEVNINYPCGTVHCYGGWYAIAACHISCPLTFWDGATAMAQHLGFETACELERWAMNNPSIWGENGEYIFTSRTAFGGASTLAEIVTYLKGVRDRSPD